LIFAILRKADIVVITVSGIESSSYINRRRNTRKFNSVPVYIHQQPKVLIVKALLKLWATRYAKFLSARI
jgi:hypothetical protein